MLFQTLAIGQCDSSMFWMCAIPVSDKRVTLFKRD